MITSKKNHKKLTIPAFVRHEHLNQYLVKNQLIIIKIDKYITHFRARILGANIYKNKALYNKFKPSVTDDVIRELEHETYLLCRIPCYDLPGF